MALPQYSYAIPRLIKSLAVTFIILLILPFQCFAFDAVFRCLARIWEWSHVAFLTVLKRAAVWNMELFFNCSEVLRLDRPCNLSFAAVLAAASLHVGFLDIPWTRVGYRCRMAAYHRVNVMSTAIKGAIKSAGYSSVPLSRHLVFQVLGWTKFSSRRSESEVEKTSFSERENGS